MPPPNGLAQLILQSSHGQRTRGVNTLIVQAVSSKYEMRASLFEQSVEIGGEGYFYVPNMIGRRPQK